MPLWQLLYLQYLDIHCCRCSFLDQCIYIFLFSWLADAFQPVCHVQLHLHLAFSGTWGYFLRKFFICIPRFLWPADAPHWNCASSTCSFYALQILLSKIMHPLLALSITCRYSPLIKFCIFNLRKSTIADISTKIISTTPTKQNLAL